MTMLTDKRCPCDGDLEEVRSNGGELLSLQCKSCRLVYPVPQLLTEAQERENDEFWADLYAFFAYR